MSSTTQFSINTTATQYKMASDPSSTYDTFRHPLELRYASMSIDLILQMIPTIARAASK